MPKKLTSKELEEAIKAYRGPWQKAKKNHAAHLSKVKFNKNLGPNIEKLLKLCNAIDGLSESEKSKVAKAFMELRVKIADAIKDYEGQVNTHVKDKAAKKELFDALDKIDDRIYGGSNEGNGENVSEDDN